MSPVTAQHPQAVSSYDLPWTHAGQPFSLGLHLYPLLAIQRKRRASPPWSPAAEGYLLLARGAFGEKNRATFDLAIRACLAMRALPLVMHTGFAHNLDKYNGKEGPDGRRLVWSLDALGKAIYRLLWLRRSNPPPRRHYCAGPYPHRSVLQGILAKRIVQHRLRVNNISHSLTKWDIRNAFPSPTHDILDPVCS